MMTLRVAGTGSFLKQQKLERANRAMDIKLLTQSTRELMSLPQSLGQCRAVSYGEEPCLLYQAQEEADLLGEN